ncbi:hypothetical protein PGT21_000967 [Puccinia graminis f. sp. tritici]|uniref:Uncharacterized protein n=1 Tax=Puccinia graminis f. sp. tritici TaxID=56615 RepID=A0A5B0PSX3_PUCGR|nr:hypothetical protein PGTUg99_002929 [Puccinia graminis f. sp. tritici]KAA1103803.1 hypothetical protein PGT21_000967 [Puccinia graminis f. sp. tritici]
MGSTSFQETTPLTLSDLSSNQKLKLDRHWSLRPWLAHNIEDSVKEILLTISDPIFDNLERMMVWELNVYDCFKEANAFDSIQTKLVLNEWFPQQGDWELFFPTMDLLKSTSCFFSNDDTPITFVGFTLEDAKALLQLDYQPPASYGSSGSGQWDIRKKELAKHLVTMMDEMRKAQGYSSMILDAHFESLDLADEGTEASEPHLNQ